MTVKELIEQLQKMPQDADVMMEDSTSYEDWHRVSEVVMEGNDTVVLT